MKIVKKNFLLTSSIIFVVVTIVLASLYFAMPVYYQQVKSGEAQREFDQVSKQVKGKSSQQIGELLSDYSKKSNLIWFTLLAKDNTILYPSLEAGDESSLQLTIVPTIANSDYESKSLSESFRTSDGKEVVLRGEYSLQPVSDASRILLNLYPFVLLVSLSLGGLAAYLYSRTSSQRIKAISKSTRQMTSLAPDVTCQVKGRDEIAELAQDIERFGDLTGKDVIHLQCHVGTDTIGFARRGASRVIGLDLSEASLAHARSIADRAGADVEFVHANVYDAREAVSGDFDLVYTSIGVLCWLPDIAQWAQVVASLLKPGGTFFIRDDHPMFMTIGEDISDGLKIEQPYFEQDTPLTWDDDSSYVDSPNAPRITHTTNHQWNHSLGQIVTALINAGLVIDELEETPRAAWCPWPELMEQDSAGAWHLREHPERLPLQFAITAHKN